MNAVQRMFAASATLMVCGFADVRAQDGGQGAQRSASPLVPIAPSRKCQITHGAWCVLGSDAQITFSPRSDLASYQWTISASDWRSEPAIILEGTLCSDAKADSIEIVGTPKKVTFEGKSWREVDIQLTRDGKCRLRLLAPTSDRAPLDAAVSMLSTGLAACFEGQPCEAHRFGQKVYGAFGSVH
ncbi:hypothetical protein EC912_11057 [Luteibacter rhizovicinus]|uniref:Uncharacterized protein n=1 Tax=Luteibacter rhizovicinus TaxID=242606 RepID=A0A4R3YH61_9GAMM|nr:hypothetical protein [Luteibacter rhizovicinus]TCV91627.1 hypothetical protein EC912_11057 [Luteibacter rhizovicinus]